MPHPLARIFLVALVAVAPPVAASPKPCRDANGRVAACPKPARAAVKRCKEQHGRFAPCDKPGNEPAQTPHS